MPRWRLIVAQEPMDKRVKFSSSRPRIGLDLHVVDGIFQGSRTHCLELFSRVVATTPECDFIALAAEPEKLLESNLGFRSPNVTLVRMPPAPAALRLLWQLPQLARRHGMDLLHSQYIAPPFSPCASAVTVHDILFETHPEYFDNLFVLRSRLLVSQAIRKSVVIFTVSDFSRRQISESFPINMNKVHIIHNGVDSERFFPGTQGQEVVKKYGLESGGYFLTVGRLEPRKNHANLLRAWAKLSSPRPRLVIAGQPHFGYQEIFDLRQALRLTEDVAILENISDAELPAFYRNAKAFIFCSWAEGFGMPVLEAMASGVPVICSKTTALTEICADAALLISPENVEQFSEAILELNQDLEARQYLARRGLSRAQEFAWESSSEIVRNVYLGYFGLTKQVA
jgi:glycosyltransferase involved in cell wall biosynthesis